MKLFAANEENNGNPHNKWSSGWDLQHWAPEWKARMVTSAFCIMDCNLSLTKCSSLRRAATEPVSFGKFILGSTAGQQDSSALMPTPQHHTACSLYQYHDGCLHRNEDGIFGHIYWLTHSDVRTSRFPWISSIFPPDFTRSQTKGR